MGDLPLFPGIPTAAPVPSLTKARALLARVEDLIGVQDGFEATCLSVAHDARTMGAHSVARACCWLSRYETFDRHGFDEIHIRAERVTRKWVERVERRAQR